jgi:hypothetical protein
MGLAVSAERGLTASPTGSATLARRERAPGDRAPAGPSALSRHRYSFDRWPAHSVGTSGPWCDAGGPRPSGRVEEASKDEAGPRGPAGEPRPRSRRGHLLSAACAPLPIGCMMGAVRPWKRFLLRRGWAPNSPRAIGATHRPVLARGIVALLPTTSGRPNSAEGRHGQTWISSSPSAPSSPRPEPVQLWCMFSGPIRATTWSADLTVVSVPPSVITLRPLGQILREPGQTS